MQKMHIFFMALVALSTQFGRASDKSGDSSAHYTDSSACFDEATTSSLREKYKQLMVVDNAWAEQAKLKIAKRAAAEKEKQHEKAASVLPVVPEKKPAKKIASKATLTFSPYQNGIVPMIAPYIAVKDLVPLVVEYVGKSDFEEYWPNSKGNLKALLEAKPDMYINSFDVDTLNIPLNIPSGKNSIMHDVTCLKNESILQKLLTLKPNVNLKAAYDKSVVERLEPRDQKMIILLVQAGADYKKAVAKWRNYVSSDPIQHSKSMDALEKFIKAIVVEPRGETPIKSIKVQDLLCDLVKKQSKSTF